ncbi:MAG: hypothetical protein KGD65_00515 [Candidatus Lokiarchaeota archaeon]|nr:hypothetical protein [Candidatus Lokiarchaeota archaeon]
MTNTVEEAEIINKYLCQIKKGLPLSIRLRKDELNDILDEIEEHIWEKVIESAGDKEPTEIDIQIAISQIGEPEDIANKFASKSTPHIYISEEIYPLYRTYWKVIFWSFFLWLAVYLIPLEVPHNHRNSYWYQISEFFLFEYIFIVLIISVSSFVFVGVIFCYLSITGYIPYKQRKSKLQSSNFNINNIQKRKLKEYIQIVILLLEISFFLFSAIYVLLFSDILIGIAFFILLSVKSLRRFTKRKSIIWQKILIILDIYLIRWVIHTLGELLFLNYLGFQEFFNFLPVLVLFYFSYEIYTFMTIRDKNELYLKELSMVKRLRTKERIFRNKKRDDNINTQNISSYKSPFSLELEEKIKLHLKKVKRKLPFWLKISEKRDIINNIEEEIREDIQELEESSELHEENLRIKFPELGNIKLILSDYKQQGTPRIFISKETWPWYLKTIKMVLSYFIIQVILSFILLISFNVIFNNLGISLFIRFSWLFWMCILILITRLFVFLSLNGFNPKRKEFLIPKKEINLRFYIWEIFFAVIYIVMGIIILFYGIASGELTTSPRIFILTIVTILSLLSLGGVKSLKLVIKKNKRALKTLLIITSLMFSLVISFFVLYDSHLDFRFIYSSLSINMFTFLFLPINIEIIYELFHFFSQLKN